MFSLTTNESHEAHIRITANSVRSIVAVLRSIVVHSGERIEIRGIPDIHPNTSRVGQVFILVIAECG